MFVNKFFIDVVLIPDVAKNFFQQVFHSYNAGCAAKFINHPCNTFALFAEFINEVGSAHTFRNSGYWKQDRTQALRVSKHIKLMNISLNIINISFIHYQLAQLGFYKAGFYFCQRKIDANCFNFFSRNKAFPHFYIRERQYIFKQFIVHFFTAVFGIVHLALLNKMLQVNFCKSIIFILQLYIKNIFKHPLSNVYKKRSNPCKHGIKKFHDKSDETAARNCISGCPEKCFENKFKK